jgi:hypothetical protein
MTCQRLFPRRNSARSKDVIGLSPKRQYRAGALGQSGSLLLRRLRPFRLPNRRIWRLPMSGVESSLALGGLFRPFDLRLRTMFACTAWVSNSLDVSFHHRRRFINSFIESASSGSALLAAWCSNRRCNPLCHDATAVALSAAEPFHEGADRGVRLEAEAGQDVSGQPGLMPAMQATDNQYSTGLTQHDITLSTRTYSPK